MPTPMDFSDYDGLKAAIQSFLNRNDADTVAAIPGFIRLAEARIIRDVRRNTVRTTLDVSDEETPLPSDVQELRTLYPESGCPWSDAPMDLTSPNELARLRALYGGVSSRPLAASVVDGSLVVAPAPDQTYTLRITYYQLLQNLSASLETNSTLTEAPDVYLYCSLIHAGPYLKDPDAMQLYKDLADAGIEGLNDRRAREEYGGSRKRVSLPRVF